MPKLDHRLFRVINGLLILIGIALFASSIVGYQYLLGAERVHERWLANPQVAGDISPGGQRTIEVLFDIGRLVLTIAGIGIGVFTG